MFEKIYKANSAPGHIKDMDVKEGVIKAYFAVFGNVDSDNDIIEMGAFSKSITERGPEGTKRIKHLKYHDTRLVPGVIKELGQDEFGAWFISQLAKNSEGEFSSLAKDTLIEYEAGVITEHSHGFEIMQWDIDEAGIRHIKESRLWEVSTLGAWGANPLTHTDYVKSLESNEAFSKAIKSITDRLKIGNFSDEYLEQLEKSFAELSAAHKSLTSGEPNAHTLGDAKPINLNRLSNLF